MPIREYECKDCQLKFETIELSSETDGVTCPRCHSENLEKKFSLFSSGTNDGASCRTSGGFSRGFG